jgi:hypothetical protein
VPDRADHLQITDAAALLPIASPSTLPSAAAHTAIANSLQWLIKGAQRRGVLPFTLFSLPPPHLCSSSHRASTDRCTSLRSKELHRRPLVRSTTNFFFATEYLAIASPLWWAPRRPPPAVEFTINRAFSPAPPLSTTGRRPVGFCRHVAGVDGEKNSLVSTSGQKAHVGWAIIAGQAECLCGLGPLQQYWFTFFHQN